MKSYSLTIFCCIKNSVVIDPACGSGNFLIITYKKLRELENNIIESLNDLSASGISVKVDSQIKLENFFGIEIDDFAHELAILSLYIAAHQMNIEFEKKFGKKLSIIPLKDNPKIVCANAARIDWQDVCPNIPREPEKRAEQSAMFDFGEPTQENLLDKIEEWDEIYLIGNPPYKGSKKQSKDQKSDFENYFKDEKYSKNLDYIALWFIKGARYITGSKAQLAFVSTNSVAQGEHVSAMFPKIFDEGVEIGFAYTSFKWRNNAKDNAGVVVAIISLRAKSNNKKKIFVEEGKNIITENINGYLLPISDVMIQNHRSSISVFPQMLFGCMPRAKGLILTEKEAEEIISKDAGSKRFIRPFLGAEDYINGKSRFCIWVEDDQYEKARKISELKERFDQVFEERSKSKAPNTRSFARKPWKFVQISNQDSEHTVIVPSVSSENRNYIPMGFISKNTIISNAANAIYDAELWLFAILQSKIHMTWIKTVCGYLGTSIRYSSTLGYNTFPVPPLSPETKQALEKSAKEILFARENHTEKTLAQMYDPAKMPTDLREAHTANDALVDSIYSAHGFENDEQRLVKLFEMYEQMTKKEK